MRIISAGVSNTTGEKTILTTVKPFIDVQISVNRALIHSRQIRSERPERIVVCAPAPRLIGIRSGGSSAVIPNNYP
jgi:hypothetical protein